VNSTTNYRERIQRPLKVAVSHVQWAKRVMKDIELVIIIILILSIMIPREFKNCNIEKWL